MNKLFVDEIERQFLFRHTNTQNNWHQNKNSIHRKCVFSSFTVISLNKLEYFTLISPLDWKVADGSLFSTCFLLCFFPCPMSNCFSILINFLLFPVSNNINVTLSEGVLHSHSALVTSLWNVCWFCVIVVVVVASGLMVVDTQSIVHISNDISLSFAIEYEFTVTWCHCLFLFFFFSTLIWLSSVWTKANGCVFSSIFKIS